MAKYMILIFGDEARWGAMTPALGLAHMLNLLMSAQPEISALRN